MQCNHCQKQNKAGATFCTGCGAPLSHPAAPAAYTAPGAYPYPGAYTMPPPQNPPRGKKMAGRIFRIMGRVFGIVSVLLAALYGIMTIGLMNELNNSPDFLTTLLASIGVVFVYFLLLSPFALSVTGLVFSIIATSKKVKAIEGIVLNGIAFLITAITFAVLYNAMSLIY